MVKNREFISTLNDLGKKREPFFFAINFATDEYILDTEDILFQLEDTKNYTPKASKNSLHVEKIYIDKSLYKNSFDSVISNIKEGNTYLLNLTCKTQLLGDIDLEEIFHAANSPFKLYIKDKFVCFSPERFVKICEDKITTYPMKGTINASLKDAKQKILSDKKEMSEHVMVVDLLRNDLGIVASNIQVDKFRYIDKIKAGDKELLQVSSKIVGHMKSNWQDEVGTTLAHLLPAGSISGTPKKKTLELIEQIEEYDRGYFSGVFGYFDGQSLDSAVMIRFIEKTKDGYVYKSGGGITVDSDMESEYQEMKDKVYVPVF